MVADEDVLARVLRDLHINFASMSEFTLQPKQEFCPLDTPFIKCLFVPRTMNGSGMRRFSLFSL